jgi:SAM-dependent methyltransferase
MENIQDIKDTVKFRFNPERWNGFKAFEYYKYTGVNLINEINELDPDLVIDAGCGHNRFKGHIKNLIGFDSEPFPFADIHMPIEEIKFREESADVVLALGSIQFGNREFVESQLKKIVSWVKPGGFIVMRTFPNISQLKNSYSWTEDDIRDFSEKFNLKVIKGVYFENIPISGNVRMAWWWQKEGTLKKFKIGTINCTIEER